MFWKLPFSFATKGSIDQKNAEPPQPRFEEKEQDVEYFKPEREEEKTDSSSESEPKPKPEPQSEPEPEPKPVLSEDDRAYAEILELEENAIEDFDAIKTLYRKRIAQYPLIKSWQWALKSEKLPNKRPRKSMRLMSIFVPNPKKTIRYNHL